MEIYRRADIRDKPLQNDCLLRALACQPTPYTPVWLMRQAGRYLPEYNATRARAGSFLALAKTPALAAEVTLQPLERFPLDAAIVFSDILTIPDAMGLGLRFSEGEGPAFERPLREEGEIRKLGAPDLSRLQYVFDAVREADLRVRYLLNTHAHYDHAAGMRAPGKMPPAAAPCPFMTPRSWSRH